MRLHGRVLAIAGSDSGGGAGVQADIKTLTALGAFACTALTAITVQDTRGVHRVAALAPDLVADQVTCALGDPGADAIKTGMLANAAVLDAVTDVLAVRAVGIPIVVDPVLVAGTGDSLFAAEAVAMRRLIGLASVVTPNLPEAEALCGIAVRDLAGMRAAAGILRGIGAAAVLVKGGHLAGGELVDLLVDGRGETLFAHRRQNLRPTHGTGCSLASAIAAGLAQGLGVVPAVGRAIAYVQQALREAPRMGTARTLLNHAVTVDAFDASVGRLMGVEG